MEQSVSLIMLKLKVAQTLNPHPFIALEVVAIVSTMNSKLLVVVIANGPSSPAPLLKLSKISSVGISMA